MFPKAKRTIDTKAVGAELAARKAEPGDSSIVNELFRRAATRVSSGLGSPWAFLVAMSFVLLWAVLGPVLNYSENWQLVINTGTSIATFLMLFIVQNSQNRDTKAINIKLDELLRAIEGARTGLANVGELSDEQMANLEGEFRQLASKDPAMTNARWRGGCAEVRGGEVDI